MKIVHIAPNAPYNGGWSYHENLLPKYHAKLGHEVTLLVSNKTHENGSIVEVPCTDSVEESGVRVIRLKRKQYPLRLLTPLLADMEVYPLLEELKPDFIYCHGLGSAVMEAVVKYCKGRTCKVVQDNHLDPNNVNLPRGFRGYAIRALYRTMVRRSMPYVQRVYGVTPWRVTFAKEYYGVPAEKLELLVMGADDEKLDLPNREAIRSRIRNQYQIGEQDFLIVTGGKIDGAKNIHLLMDACQGMEKVKLLIFGHVLENFQSEFEKHLQGRDNIISIGWIPADQIYAYFFAADLVAFPGGHSVMWEQACASKTPCLFKRWEQMEHVDQGGNCAFVDTITVQSLRQSLEGLVRTEAYDTMKAAASGLTDVFRYSAIAEKSLECGIKP